MPTSPYKTVVVPIDFSDDSITAIQTGRQYAEDPAGLHVLHVLPELRYAGPLFEEWGQGRPRAEVVRERIEELINEAGANGAQAAVRVGDAGLTTVDFAKSVDAGLIVVPSHGHHGMRRILLGSTAERIIRHADCSVLVLRRTDAR